MLLSEPHSRSGIHGPESHHPRAFLFRPSHRWKSPPHTPRPSFGIHHRCCQTAGSVPPRYRSYTRSLLFPLPLLPYILPALWSFQIRFCSFPPVLPTDLPYEIHASWHPDYSGRFHWPPPLSRLSAPYNPLSHFYKKHPELPAYRRMRRMQYSRPEELSSQSPGQLPASSFFSVCS